MSPAGQPRLRRYLPDALLVDARSLLRDTALVCEGERVIGLEPAGDLPAGAAPPRRFPGELWAARPVMAHAHLESYDAPASSWPRESFAAWVEALLAWRGQPRLAPAESARLSLTELAAAGCGLVVAHVAEAEAGAGATRQADPELLALPELFEPDPSRADSALAGALEAAGSAGVALHSPFGVSMELAHATFAAVERVSIHLGEHEEERQLLAAGAGPLARLLGRRRRALPSARWDSPVDWLEQAGGARPGTLAVHGGALSAAELRRLQDAGVGLVWCPGTHRYFDRPEPAFVEAGGPLPALGCDSRASNERLDPLREFRLACELLPEPGPAAWWQAATENAAALLGRPELGHLRPGARCRPLRLPLGPIWGAAAEPSAAVLLEGIAKAAALQPLGSLPEPA